jgi:ankyrin repeat protein
VNTCRFANTRNCGLGKEEFSQLKYLLSKGCNFDVLDSDGHDGLHYAIKNNDTLLVDLIAKSLDKHALIVDLKDAEGNTAVHHCVQTSEFGSFENTQILEALHKMGFNLNVKNNQGVTPFDLSLGQSSGRMGNKLMELSNVFETDIAQRTPKRKTSVPEAYPQSKFDYNQDS